METFVVTGGAGFIGSAFIRYMLNRYRDRKIVCFDALTYAADMSNLSSVITDPLFSFIKGDITAEYDVENLFEAYRPSVIVNFAAESHVDRSIESPSLFIKTNVDGTGTLLDASLRHGIRRSDSQRSRLSVQALRTVRRRLPRIFWCFPITGHMDWM